MKEQARARYQSIYTKAGLDADKILEDDPQEVCKLAVWSYEQFEMRINTMNHNEDDDLLSDNSEGSEVEQSAYCYLPIRFLSPHRRGRAMQDTQDLY